MKIDRKRPKGPHSYCFLCWRRRLRRSREEEEDDGPARTLKIQFNTLLFHHAYALRHATAY